MFFSRISSRSRSSSSSCCLLIQAGFVAKSRELDPSMFSYNNAGQFRLPTTMRETAGAKGLAQFLFIAVNRLARNKTKHNINNNDNKTFTTTIMSS